MKTISARFICLPGAVFFSFLSIFFFHYEKLFAVKYTVNGRVHQVDGPMEANDVNQKVLKIVLNVGAGGGGATLNLMQFNLSGNNEIAAAKLFFRPAVDDSSFSAATQIGATLFTPGATITFSGLSAANSGTGNWFYWLVLDAKATITNSVIIDAELTDISGSTTPGFQNNAGAAPPFAPPIAPSGFRFTSRNYLIGAGEQYSTIKETADAIARFDYDGTGDIFMELTANYANPVETQIIFKNHTGPATITIRPASLQTGKITSGDPGSGIYFIGFGAGVQKIILDGRPGGTGTIREWTIRNTRVTSIIAGAIAFLDAASVNTLAWLNIEAANTVEGIVAFSTSTGATGNNNNSISNCLIKPTAAGFGATNVGVYSSGTAGRNNSGNTIDNCEFSNILANSAGSSHISIVANSDNWTITNNSFYNTTNFSGITNPYTIISIAAGSGYNVSGNFIGGKAKNCGGAALSISSSSDLKAIHFGSSVTGNNTINGNTIANISYTAASATADYMVKGIFLQGGANYTVGSAGNGNNLGSMTSTGSIAITNTFSGSFGFAGIRTSSTGTVNIAHNNIGGITVGASGGINNNQSMMISRTAGAVTIDNNIIGGTVANSITQSSNAALFGINNSNAGGITVTNNTIQNFNHSGGTGTDCNAIVNADGPLTATGNTIRNFTLYSNVNNYSIFHGPTTSAIATISNNIIQDISSTSTGSSASYYGILIQTGSAVICNGNTIGSTNSNNISIAGNAASYGINKTGAGSLTCNNNVIQQVNMTNTGTGSVFSGIALSSTAGQLTSSANEIKNISSVSTRGMDVLVGLNMSSTNTTHLIEKLTVTNLFSNATTADNRVNAIALYAGGGKVSKCFVKGLENLRSSSLASIFGIWLEPGSWNIYNNVIILDNGANTNDVKLYGIYDNTSASAKNIYHNTIKLGGTVSSGATLTTCYRKVLTSPAVLKNNILQNLRTGGTAEHVAIQADPTGFTEDFDYLEVASDQNKLAKLNAVSYNFSGWNTVNSATGNKNGAITLDANGKATTDPFPGAGTGTNLTATITDDKLDVTRGIASWMGAYEGPDITTSAISPLAYCAGDAISVPYTVGGGDNFSGGNIFTAQLSNSTGDFSSPINIGTLASSVSGTINGTIPLTTGSASYTAQGSFIWTCPPGVTTISVECWGGGGGGGGSKTGTNSSAGGGGAGGSYAKKTMTVIPGNNYTVNVGNGGTGGFAGFPGMTGSDSWFNNVATIKAQGGPGGTQGSNGSGGLGTIAASVGDVLYAGGNGGMGTDNAVSGGGGGGAGSGGNGGIATGMASGSGTANGGGNGGSGGGPVDYNGMTGMNYGGGGSGGYRNNFDASGGMGASGKVEIKYLVSGSGYRIRVVSSDPIVTGSDNGENINIQSAAPSAPTANAASAINCNGFTSNWTASAGTANYFLDVATDAGFTAFVPGYNNLDVGNVTSKVITGLIAGTNYYYRVRAANGCGTSGNSGTQSATTTGAQRVLVVSSTANGTTTDGVSLRWAITEANNNCGHDSIHFGFGAGGPFTISLNTALPAITGTEGVTIDGFNNSWCVLTGTVATNGTTLVTGSGTSFLSEMAPGALININGEKRIVATVPGDLSLTVTTAFSLTAASQKAFKECASPNNGTPNTVAVFDATAAPVNPMNPVYKIILGNGLNVVTGFVINNGSNYNVIKGLVLQDFGDGTPSGNDIAITVSGNDNKVNGCYIGIGSDGVTGGTKTYIGISVSGANNRIGDGTAAGANLISGANSFGLNITDASATGNTVRGNMIGLQKDGSTLVTGGQSDGIILNTSATLNTIGGTNAGDGNVISGQTASGIYLVSGGNGSNTIAGNIIGPRADGVTYVTGNTQGNGFWIFNSNNNIIGGNTPEERNIISGNETAGIAMPQTSTGNIIKGNYIGIAKNGTSFITGSSQDYGIRIYEASNSNIIGGSGAGEGNVISGNKDAGTTGRGISLESSHSSGNTVLGNIIGPQADGITNLASNGQYRGLEINGSTNNTIGGNTAEAGNIISANEAVGVQISGAAATGNNIKGNYIGINKTGDGIITGSTQDLGVSIDNSAAGNTIGGSGAGEGNVISGNKDCCSTAKGIYLTSSAAAGNSILGNIIGLSADGISHLSSNAQFYGIYISSSQNNTIGGNSANARNIISANENSGVFITGASAIGNAIKGNYIGIDKNGTTFIAGSSQNYGVFITSSAASNIIGDSGAGEGNVISGNNDGSNAGIGIYLASTAVAGNTILGNIIGPQSDGQTYLASNPQNIGISIVNSVNNTIGGNTAGARNIISANGEAGVYIGDAGSTGNIVKGNYIGIDKTGTTIIAGSTQDYGVFFELSGADNTIGGSGANEGNVISGNTKDGFSGWGIYSNSDGGNTVLGNIIGPQTDGINYLSPHGQQIGISIISSSGNTIGGNSIGARNIISANETYGVFITGAGSTGNVVKGNYIGIDKNGTTFITGSTQDYGVYISSSAASNIIGGSGPGEGNVISGNKQSGTAGWGIYSSSSAAGGNSVLGNIIGPQSDGLSYLSSNAQFWGIILSGSPNNIIGGNSAGARNIISANETTGISISGASSTGNIIKGNYIGASSSLTDITGSNQDYGVFFYSSAANNQVGTGLANEENQIAFNTVNGVYLVDAGTTGNLISRNPVFSNTGKAINLNYGASQGNNGKAVPVITNATLAVINGTAGVGNTIEIFKNTTGNCNDATIYVGLATADGAGKWSLAVALSPGDYVLASARDGSNNTSEFCTCVAAGNFVYNITSSTYYSTIQAAYDALTPPIALPYIIEILNGYTGEYIYPLNIYELAGASAANTITIRPNVSGLSIAGSSGTTLIDFYGGDYIIFDGRVGGAGSTKDLVISNSNITGSTIRFIMDATYNIIKFCKVTGVETPATMV